MRSELRLHRIVFGILVVLLAGFIFLLLHLHSSLASARLEAIASLVIVAAAAVVFVMTGLVEEVVAFQFGRKHKRELLSYLLLGFVSLATGFYLAISQTASLQTVALVTAPHALLFGAGEFRIALHMQRHRGYRRALALAGFIEFGMGIVLVSGSRMSNERAAILLGYVATVSVLELLPLVLFSHPRASQQVKI